MILNVKYQYKAFFNLEFFEYLDFKIILKLKQKVLLMRLELTTYA